MRTAGQKAVSSSAPPAPAVAAGPNPAGLAPEPSPTRDRRPTTLLSAELRSGPVAELAHALEGAGSGELSGLSKHDRLLRELADQGDRLDGAGVPLRNQMQQLRGQAAGWRELAEDARMPEVRRLEVLSCVAALEKQAAELEARMAELPPAAFREPGAVHSDAVVRLGEIQHEVNSAGKWCPPELRASLQAAREVELKARRHLERARAVHFELAARRTAACQGAISAVSESAISFVTVDLNLQLKTLVSRDELSFEIEAGASLPIYKTYKRVRDLLETVTRIDSGALLMRLLDGLKPEHVRAACAAWGEPVPLPLQEAKAS